MGIFKKKENGEGQPLIKLTLIIIPTVAVVLITLFILNMNGFFMSKDEKICGRFERTRVGSYSGGKYTEAYVFNNDGTGMKSYMLPSKKVTSTTFTWEITEKSVLVIDGHVKYYWNPSTSDYYNITLKTIKEYWYVSNDELVIGKSDSMEYELYTKTE